VTARASYRSNVESLIRTAGAVGLWILLYGCERGASDRRMQDAPVDHSRIDVWQVGPQRLTIGASGTDTADQFIRVVGAAVLEDRFIVVADEGSKTLRVFSFTGELLGVYGRLGGGPGEFSAVSGPWAVAGDTLVAFDPISRRLSTWTATGGLVSERSVGAGTLLQAIGIQNDETLIVTSRRPAHNLAAGELVEDSVHVMAVDYRNEDEARELVRLPNELRYASQLPDGRTMYMQPPFSMALRMALNGNEILSAQGTDPFVNVYSMDGRVLRQLAVPWPRQPFSTTLRDEYVEAMASAGPRMERAGYRRFFRDLPYPPELPTFDSMKVGIDGRVWLRRFDYPEGVDAEWAVLSAEGDVQALVSMPRRTSPVVILDSMIVAVNLGQYDEQTITIHELVKPRPPR
jgi:hypothetical protein